MPYFTLSGGLSPEMYVDSSLVKANVNSHGLSPSGMSVEEFKEQAVQVNGLFVCAGCETAANRMQQCSDISTQSEKFLSEQCTEPIAQMYEWQITRPCTLLLKRPAHEFLHSDVRFTTQPVRFGPSLMDRIEGVHRKRLPSVVKRTDSVFFHRYRFN